MDFFVEQRPYFKLKITFWTYELFNFIMIILFEEVFMLYIYKHNCNWLFLGLAHSIDIDVLQGYF